MDQRVEAVFSGGVARLPELREQAAHVDTVFLATWTLGLVFGSNDPFVSREARVFSAASDLLAGVVGVLQARSNQRSVDNFAHNLERLVRPCLAPGAPIILCLIEAPTRLNPDARLAAPAIARLPGRNPETLPTLADLAAYIARSSI